MISALVIINNNCQEYDFSMESLLLHCNKPFHFCSKADTHMTLLLINFQNKRATLRLIARITSSVQASFIL